VQICCGWLARHVSLQLVSNEGNSGGDSVCVQQVPHQDIHTKHESKMHRLPVTVQNRKEERSGITFYHKRLKFEKTDEYGAFGKFVAQELCSLRSEVNRRLLKRMIQKTILKVSELDEKKQTADESKSELV
jgi:hypothetical protein